MDEKKKQIAKEKQRQTCMERYGYEYSSQSPEIRAKISIAQLRRISEKKSNENLPKVITDEEAVKILIKLYEDYIMYQFQYVHYN